jgi:hypothetical protein
MSRNFSRNITEDAWNLEPGQTMWFLPYVPMKNRVMEKRLEKQNYTRDFVGCA